MAYIETPTKTLQIDEVQKSEWRFILRPDGVSIRPDMRRAEDDGLKPWEVVIDPTMIGEVITILEEAEEHYLGPIDE